MERYSGMTLLVQTVSTSAEQTAKDLFTHYVLKYGQFDHILNESPSFVSELFQHFIKLVNPQAAHFRTTSYRPECNGLTEQKNLLIIKYFRAH